MKIKAKIYYDKNADQDHYEFFIETSENFYLYSLSGDYEKFFEEHGNPLNDISNFELLGEFDVQKETKYKQKYFSDLNVLQSFKEVIKNNFPELII